MSRQDRHSFLERASQGDKTLVAEVEALLLYHPEEQPPTGMPDIRLEQAGGIRAAVDAGPPGSHPIPAHPSASRRESTPSGSARTPIEDRSRLPMPSGTPKPDVSEAKFGAIPDGIDHGMFEPGHVILGRYRIVERIGRGGMGTVYRADDRVLNQPVALKFLPEALADQPSRKARFLNEARVALQITHPNVCRVHDVGEVNGRQFISMEFVDGDDISSLLKRVGRPPVERALSLAHQVCAGLQAAHDKGVLHRDLKPANVMVDSEGNAKILDFGLAGMAAGISGNEVKAGTPTYMAPEQLRGDEVTVRSDVYGLGILFYELFTGKKVWDAATIAELMHMHKTREAPDPRDAVPTLDARIAMAIVRCLARDPADRPTTARGVSALLPGGDPLAAALAAGETPSPEVVAQAGGRGVLRPMSGVLLMLALLAMLGAILWFAPRVAMQEKAYLEKSPAVLASDAEEVFARLGYSVAGQHVAWSLDYYEELVREIEMIDTSADRWERLARPRPAAIDFWYRASPAPLRPQNAMGKVTMTDPAPTEPGMISLRLSPNGKLRELYVRYRDAEDLTTPDGWRPPAIETDAERTWRLLFELSDLRFEEFKRVEPHRVPPVFADERAAWEGVYHESPEVEVRVEIATYRGQAVSFRLIEKRWPRASQVGVPEELLRGGARLWTTTGMAALLVVASLLLVPGNVMARRVDYFGAFKVGVGGTIIWMLGWWLRASHVWTLRGETELLGRMAGQSLLVGCALVVFYMAMEPYVRRTWPQMLITWERILSGRIRDSLVGKHAAVGVALGAAAAAAFYASLFVPTLLGDSPPPPFMDARYGMDAMSGARTALGALLHMTVASAREGMAMVLALVVIRMATKRTWIAASIFAVLIGVFWAMLSGSIVPHAWPLLLFMAALLAYVIVHYGLLSAAVAALVYHLLVAFPLTMNPRAWYFDATIFSNAVVVISAGLGVLMATGVIRGHSEPASTGLSSSRL